MRDRSVSRTPVTTFPLPPGAPEAVAAAEREFDRAADEWGSVTGEIADAREAAEQAKTAAKAQAVEDAMKGKKATGTSVYVEREYLAQLEELEAREEALAAATDQLGNKLAKAIGANRTDWAETIAEREQAAEERLGRALSEARAAAVELGNLRRAGEWIHDYDVGEAITGRATPFGGGVLRVDLGFGLRGEQHAAAVLKLIADAVTAPPAARTRTLRRVNTVAESRVAG